MTYVNMAVKCVSVVLLMTFVSHTFARNIRQEFAEFADEIVNLKTVVQDLSAKLDTPSPEYDDNEELPNPENDDNEEPTPVKDEEQDSAPVNEDEERDEPLTDEEIEDEKDANEDEEGVEIVAHLSAKLDTPSPMNDDNEELPSPENDDKEEPTPVKDEEKDPAPVNEDEERDEPVTDKEIEDEKDANEDGEDVGKVVDVNVADPEVSIPEINYKIDKIGLRKEDLNFTVEGDELFTDKQEKDMAYDNVKHDAIRSVARHWPKTNGYVTIPLVITPSINGDSTKMKAIWTSIAAYKKQSCIRFETYSSYSAFHIKVINARGCYSSVGYIGGFGNRKSQDLSIGPNCGQVAVVQHEMLHALGFFHEQSRPDRDTYVRVNWQNIDPQSMRGNFDKEEAANVDSMGIPYDLSSIMQYSSSTFARRNTRVLERKDGKNGGNIPYTHNFSPTDLLQLNCMYKCDQFVTIDANGKCRKKGTQPRPQPRPQPKPQPVTNSCKDIWNCCSAIAAYMDICSRRSVNPYTHYCNKSCGKCRSNNVKTETTTTTTATEY